MAVPSAVGAVTAVRVIGSVPELGSWNESLGLPLVQQRSAQGQHVWASAVATELPFGLAFEYSFVAVVSDADAAPKPEPCTRALVADPALPAQADAAGSIAAMTVDVSSTFAVCGGSR